MDFISLEPRVHVSVFCFPKETTLLNSLLGYYYIIPIVIVVIVILLAVYQKQIVHWLEPATKKIKKCVMQR